MWRFLDSVCGGRPYQLAAYRLRECPGFNATRPRRGAACGAVIADAADQLELYCTQNPWPVEADHRPCRSTVKNQDMVGDGSSAASPRERLGSS